MPKYKFQWSNIPGDVLRALSSELITNADQYDPAQALCDVYGARPKDEFVREAWPTLLDTWVKDDAEARGQIVTALRQTRGEDGTLTKRPDQLAYLRDLRNAKNLRAIVLEAFIAAGESEPAAGERPPTELPPVKPPVPAEPVHKPHPPPPGEHVTTTAETPQTAQEAQPLNIAPGSIVVIRDEEWLVTSAEQGADGWLVRVRGLSELVADTTAAFYSSLDTIEPQDPKEAKVIADGSSGYRDARLWLEALLRKTPVPYGEQALSVSTHMLGPARQRRPPLPAAGRRRGERTRSAGRGGARGIRDHRRYRERAFPLRARRVVVGRLRRSAACRAAR